MRSWWKLRRPLSTTAYPDASSPWNFVQDSESDTVSNTAKTVYGIDFTSRPAGNKPLPCVECRLNGNLLEFIEVLHWYDFDDLEEFLGPQNRGLQWIAGIDSPFSMPWEFVNNNNWPMRWRDYIDEHISGLCTRQWRAILEGYAARRGEGDKEHRRHTDRYAGSVSPQHIGGPPPVGWMLLQCAPRLRRSGVFIPFLQDDGDCNRIVVEAYPGVAIREFLGNIMYKAGNNLQEYDEGLRQARMQILGYLASDRAEETYGCRIVRSPEIDHLAVDQQGDDLDSLICAFQAAWAWLNRENNFGLPEYASETEGWIADPIWRRYVPRL